MLERPVFLLGDEFLIAFLLARSSAASAKGSPAGQTGVVLPSGESFGRSIRAAVASLLGEEGGEGMVSVK